MLLQRCTLFLIAMLITFSSVWAQEVVPVEEVEPVEPTIVEPSDGVQQARERQSLLREQQELRQRLDMLQQKIREQEGDRENLMRVERALRRQNEPSGRYTGGQWYGHEVIPTDELPAIDWEKDADTQIRVFQLQYAPVEAILPMMQKLFSGKLTISKHPTNQSLIVIGDESGFKLFEDILQTLDTKPQEPEPIQTADMAVRVYAIENQPVVRKVVEQFNLEIDVESELDIDKLMSLVDETFSIKSIKLTDENKYLLEMYGYEKGIAGKATSLILNELGVKGQGTQLDVGDVSKGPVLLDVPIPETVQPTLKNLLGANLFVTGYWFGNTSMPGTVEAPLGDWKIVMESVDGQDDNFRLDVSVFKNQNNNRTMWNFTKPQKFGSNGVTAPVVTQSYGMAGSSSNNSGISFHSYEWPTDQKNSLILRNAVTGRIGRPIIIGYNRSENGQIRLGALVIIPEREFGGGSGKASSGYNGHGGYGSNSYGGGGGYSGSGSEKTLFKEDAPSQQLNSHTVQPGETLFQIAEQYGTKPNTLREMNKLYGDSVRVGAKLSVPATEF